MLTVGSVTVVLMSVAFAAVSAFMMLVILIQRPKGGGLSGAFGGAGSGSTQAAFGAKVGDVLTIVTIVCFILFLLLAIGLTGTIRPEANGARSAAAQQEPAAAGDPGVTEALEEAVDMATSPPAAPDADPQPDADTSPVLPPPAP